MVPTCFFRSKALEELGGLGEPADGLCHLGVNNGAVLVVIKSELQLFKFVASCAQNILETGLNEAVSI